MTASHLAVTSTTIEDRLEVRARAAAAQSAQASCPTDDSVEITDSKALISKWLYEYLTGHKARAIGRRMQGAPGPQWSVSYTHREVRHEVESTSFAASGSVKLASGAKIEFSIELSLQREETEVNGVSIQAGNMTDPIAVNLDGAGARLAPNGIDETIANLAAGSAWLARDINGNGKLDNGTELFGPATGNGFAELRALDGDANGWIDEGDAAYSQLGLWSDGSFTSLAQAGIGALSVDSLATPFTMKSGQQTLGQLSASGVYLREDGGAGLIQQVDLAA